MASSQQSKDEGMKVGESPQDGGKQQQNGAPETDIDSGVDENTQQGDGSPKTGSGGTTASRIPRKTPPDSPVKNRSRRPKPAGTPNFPRSKSVPKPFTGIFSIPPSTAESVTVKKVPMNKIVVGVTASPNLKQVRSKIGSLENASYKPGGGEVKIESRKLEWKTNARTTNFNDGYVPKGGDKKIESRKLEWNATSRIGSLENASHKPGGGDKSIQVQKLDWKANSKVGSTDNIKHKPGGGRVKPGRVMANRKWNSVNNVGVYTDFTGPRSRFRNQKSVEPAKVENGEVNGDAHPEGEEEIPNVEAPIDPEEVVENGEAGGEEEAVVNGEEDATEEVATEAEAEAPADAEEPAPEEAGTEEPAAEEPATEEPAAEEPAAEEPAEEEPAAEEPAAEEVATEETAPEAEEGAPEEAVDEAAAEEVTPETEEVPPEEENPEEATPEEAAPEEPPPEEAAPGEAVSEEAAPEEAAPEEAAPEEAAPEETAPEEPVTEEVDPETASPEEAAPEAEEVVPQPEEAPVEELPTVTEEEEPAAEAAEAAPEVEESVTEADEPVIEPAEGVELTDVPNELRTASGMAVATDGRTIERLSEEQARTFIRGRPIVMRIPAESRESWKPEEPLVKPALEFELEWVYGYRGQLDGHGNPNLYYLPTGEIVYFVAAVAVLYNLESHTQRHYTGHTNDIHCIAIHPGGPYIATGQAEGHSKISSTIQQSHVQVWNYDDLSMICIIGLDDLPADIACVSFSDLIDGKSYLSVVDASQNPNLIVYKNVESGSSEIVAKSVYSDQIFSSSFYPQRPNILVTTGKNHVVLWTFEDGGGLELQKKLGLFTRKIPRPRIVTCCAFALTGEILTGDSDGNVMVWKGIKVVRVLKGAHQGNVADICMMDDGSFISGGKDDGALVIFNERYELIGAGAVLPKRYGTVNCFLKRTFAVTGDGVRFYHLYVGTQRNCVVDLTFSVKQGTTDIQDFALEVLLQGHVSEIRGVQALINPDEHFVSCSREKDVRSVIWWDAVAHRAVWTEGISSRPTCIDTSRDGTRIVVGTEAGTIVVIQSDNIDDERAVQEHEISLTQIDCVSIAPEGNRVAVGAHDNNIYIAELDPEGDIKETVRLLGHTSSVVHVDWSSDGLFLRSNSSDYELLFWRTQDGDHLTTDAELEAIPSSWATNSCTLTFNTMGVWPEIADGTDINACDVSEELNVVAVADDFGRVRIYRYPDAQSEAESLELLGHSSHVTGVTFLPGSRLVSTGGIEGSILQWKATAV